MANDNISYAFLISNFEFLKKEDPTNELGIGILLKYEVPKNDLWKLWF